jgi:glycerol-3-phosphate dehydrogenase
MAEDTVDKAIVVGNLPDKRCITSTLKIHGWSDKGKSEEVLKMYGTDAEKILTMISANPDLGKRIDDAWPFTDAEVVWAVRNETARNVEDMLARRFRVLFLDAKAAIRMAPAVAKIMKEELKKDEEWERQQVDDFMVLASQYLIKE